MAWIITFINQRKQPCLVIAFWCGEELHAKHMYIGGGQSSSSYNTVHSKNYIIIVKGQIPGQIISKSFQLYIIGC